MKYGALDFEKTVRWYWANTWNHKALLNIGDAAEYLAVTQLYHALGIGDEQIVPLCIHDLIAYRGETLLVALNIALDSYVGYNEILERLSPDIVPVFLGMSFTSPQLNQRQLDCLRAYAPIGCRDQRSYETLKRHGIPCYLNGCCASMLRLPPVAPVPALSGKILVIDAPQSLAEHIPQHIQEKAVCFAQELYCHQERMPRAATPAQWAQSILNAYGSSISAIITSRFHGAVLALAFGIPVLVALEQKTFRFSWLENYCQVLAQGDFHRIDWGFPTRDYAPVREHMRKLCMRRVQDAAARHAPLAEITDMQKISAPPAEETNAVLYYEPVWKEILQRWDPAEEIQFAFWGINDNSARLLEAIGKAFPKARLADIYDMHRTVSFHGQTSKSPMELSKRRQETNYYLIVTAYLASRVAEDIFERTGFPGERAFLCHRAFITPRDLETQHAGNGGVETCKNV